MDLGYESPMAMPIVVRFMDDVFGIYAVGNGAEEQLVKEYYGGIAVGYPPPLVLNVEQPADLHRFLELELNTGGGGPPVPTV